MCVWPFTLCVSVCLFCAPAVSSRLRRPKASPTTASSSCVALRVASSGATVYYIVYLPVVGRVVVFIRVLFRVWLNFCAIVAVALCVCVCSYVIATQASLVCAPTLCSQSLEHCGV